MKPHPPKPRGKATPKNKGQGKPGSATRHKISDQQRAFIQMWPSSFNYRECAEALGVTEGCCRHWNCRALNPHLKDLIDAEIVKHYGRIKGHLEILFTENRERIFNEMWDVYAEARIEADRTNAIRVLQNLAKVAGMEVSKTEITGADGKPLLLPTPGSSEEEMSFEGWPAEKIKTYIDLRREAIALAKAKSDGNGAS